MKGELKFKKFLNALAFVALAISGIALIVALILGKLNTALGFANALRQVAYCLAFVVTAVVAYGYVRTKRSVAWLVVYILCVVFIVVPLVIGMFHI